MAGMKNALHEILRKRMDPAGLAWLDKALAATQPLVHANTLLGYYAGASRRAGKRALTLDPAEQGRLRGLDPGIQLGVWGMDEAVRALLLLSLTHLPADEFARLAAQCYELGDSREQQSWLRALALLPQPERFLAAATDACRTNILPLFEAIACENPYPARWFPELNFNQMVMKSLFNGVALERIAGLRGRTNRELSRMTFDYLREREAAGRAVPADIWLALIPHISGEQAAHAVDYLVTGSPEQRYWLSVALGESARHEHRQTLEAQQRTESDPRVAGAIRESLARLNAART
jgi:hypothetical protein